MSITGLLLAGGKSSRFGTPKALASYKNKLLYQYSFEALQVVTNQIVTISVPHLQKTFQKQGRLVVVDRNEVKGKGPLAGIYTGMNTIKSDWYVVIPCDMPLIDGKVLNKIVDARMEKYDAIIPKVFGKVQPLVGVYHCRTAPIIQSFLQKDNLKVMALVNELYVKYLDEHDLQLSENIFQNINYQEDLKRIGKS
ncbi:molybdenum cofactor guanylyltransferase [Sutcliffiella sp. NC1]|uniref:molybdenum cofactor guanylyltransferase n=1 Tax=Sutcliffiella sp. NC1 TaxID=3004096 RepID=UPI0022DD2C13|nr:molybdenum cofactor guanylyltransferase [Sutcliffiella sp. NC1]WBL16056.1 molybdenum cofactor guanylyltransferase [Sutcliffiella sp. NC1]